MNIELFDAAVAQLKAASNGLYPGPKTSSATLSNAFNSTAGLDTSMIEQAASQVGGRSHPGKLRPMGPLLETVLREFAEAAIGVGLEKLLRGVVRGHERNVCVGQATARAGSVISTIDQESALTCDAALATLSTAMQPLLAAIMAANPVLNPIVGTTVFPSLIKTAGGLIDAAASLIMGTCSARDQAINDCFDTLIGECEQAATEPEACVNPSESPQAPEAQAPPQSCPTQPQAAPASQATPVPKADPAPPTTPTSASSEPRAMGSPPVQPASLGSALPTPPLGAEGVNAALGAVGEFIQSAGKGVVSAAQSGLAPAMTPPAMSTPTMAAPPNGPGMFGEIISGGLTPDVETQQSSSGFGINIDIKADIDIEACGQAAEQCAQQSSAETPAPPKETKPEHIEPEAAVPPEAPAEPAPAPESPPTIAAEPEAPTPPEAAAPEPAAPEPAAPPAPEVVCEPQPEAAPPAEHAKKAGGWS
ncbi:hypothetical protein [Corynebacterium gerontici]|uniref:Uncharacterized protein n=1 Tax=Corynebacterium gerontici TaxID=2079234 RepID=A0A3G6J1V6_9CORY|nr:hypothetical protein [Corynebacterium gerontici]AZA12041.1 hypothetical protein CGERO_08750 [Corynebacterium gerontici]